jgi:carbon-monoxide dehydrogenase iron sulfur subunit
MAQGIVIDIGRCTGCGYCELMCSFAHHGEFNPLKSRIHANVFIEKSTAVPVVCYQCEDPWCAKACPAGALTIHRDSDGQVRVVQVQKEKCVGCKMCTLACPFGCITVMDGHAQKCDLCAGDPQCVKVCRARAIKYMEVPAGVTAKRKSVAERLLASFQED